MSYPYFDNFILDGLFLLFSFGLVCITAYVVLMAGSIAYAVLRGLFDKLRKKNKNNE